MEPKSALSKLSALAQENRLAVFRLLVKAGHDGLPAGEIAAALDVPPNTLSAQLNILSNAGLVEGKRHGRSIIYTANYDAISGLIVFLMEDCCQGREEVCSPIMAAAQSACC
ncbi:metalloregulator ArsR/SmtB family transcription factor [uncultured Hyphomonas sp.]|uniref:ArsR/SmtB family transcription factor n=1 Tax=uncultured Hyphomonas sp. TaxID=225298 RepID=UPI002AAC2ABD|nr:metalloregulator ArsR/SmtB family transcription factor [uncultured Hyphomonas sp.]